MPVVADADYNEVDGSLNDAEESIEEAKPAQNTSEDDDDDEEEEGMCTNNKK